MSWTFLVAALALQLTPGPGMLFILANGISGGARAGVAAAFGAASGMVVHTFAAALGLAALFHAVPPAYTVVRVAGGVYLLWIALSHLRAAREPSPHEVAAPRRSDRRVFVRAFLNNLANPKVVLFYIAFLPQFVDRSAGAVTLQFVELGFAFLLVGLAIDIAIGAGAGRVGAVLRRRTGFRRALDAVAGTIIGALGLRVLARP